MPPEVSKAQRGILLLVDQVLCHAQVLNTLWRANAYFDDWIIITTNHTGFITSELKFIVWGSKLHLWSHLAKLTIGRYFTELQRDEVLSPTSILPLLQLSPISNYLSFLCFCDALRSCPSVKRQSALSPTKSREPTSWRMPSGDTHSHPF